MNVGADEAAKQKADDIRKRALAGEVVRTARRGVLRAPPSKANGGLIGPLNTNELTPGFRQLVDGMKVGDVSEVIRGQGGYQMIKLETRTADKVMTAEEARDKIADALYEEKRPVDMAATWTSCARRRSSSGRTTKSGRRGRPMAAAASAAARSDAAPAAEPPRHEPSQAPRKPAKTTEHADRRMSRAARFRAEPGGPDALVRRLDPQPARAGRPHAARRKSDPGVPADDVAVEPVEGSKEAYRRAAVSRLRLRAVRSGDAAGGAQVQRRRLDRVVQRRARAGAGSRDRKHPDAGGEHAAMYDPCPTIKTGTLVEVSHGPLKGVVGRLARKGSSRAWCCRWIEYRRRQRRGGCGGRVKHSEVPSQEVRSAK